MASRRFGTTGHVSSTFHRWKPSPREPCNCSVPVKSIALTSYDVLPYGHAHLRPPSPPAAVWFVRVRDRPPRQVRERCCPDPISAASTLGWALTTL